MAINFWFSFVLSLDFAEHETVTRLEIKWRRNDSQYCVLNAWYLDTLSHRRLGALDFTQCHLRTAGLEPWAWVLAAWSIALLLWARSVFCRCGCCCSSATQRTAKEMVFSLQLWLSELPGFHLHGNKHITKMPWLASKAPAASRAVWTSSWVSAPSSAHKPHDSYWRVADKSGHPKRMLMRATLLSVHWPKAKPFMMRGPNSHQLQQPSRSLITNNDWSVTWHLQRKENQRRGLLSCHGCWRIAARGKVLE